MEVRERLATALACAAVDPGLAGVLLLDLDPALAAPLGEWLAELLPGRTRSTVLPSEGTDDDLWVTMCPASGGDAGFRPVPGPLHAAGRRPAVLVVPDLSRAGLAISRAAVTTLAAAVAHLERDGQQGAWVPADRWVTGCPTDRTGRVSRHLLDRFALRIDAAGLKPAPHSHGLLKEPPKSWRQAVGAAHENRPLPQFSAAAADRVLELLPATRSGTRRDLSLARTARALAYLAGDASAEARHVDEAASLTGLLSPVTAPAPAGREARSPAPEPRGEGGEDTPGAPATSTARVPHQVRVGDEGPTTVPSKPLFPDAAGPYPEDTLADEREVAPLLPPRHRSAVKALRGHPIGTTTATTTRDLSLTATAREAAKYQVMRCPSHYADGFHPLHLTAADLRAHRRAAESSRLLVLLLDHTSRRGIDWYPLLSPYLSGAYVSRSRVALVEVGADEAGPELAASMFVCRSLLDPSIVRALNRSPGLATPLAHGLHLAASLLRHETQHGGAFVDEALLLVFTDGRANVPLDASRSLRTPTAVGDRGVQDALEQAQRIARLPRVRCVVLHPGARPLEHLVAQLADALGAEVSRADQVETDVA
ncbi:magnesium chelatase [Streptomyces massasporeus]